jgi:hypothetical protein
MAHCADCQLAWRSDNGKWRTVVVGQNDVNWCYVCVLCVWVCECVCVVGVSTVNGVFIYKAHKGKWLCVLVTKNSTICSHSCLRQILKLNTNPTLSLTLPATHRPAAALPLLTCQQLTVWQLNVGGVLGSLMLPSYFVPAWDYYKGKMDQQHIKQFNIHSQHLLLGRREFFRPHFGVQNARQYQHRIYTGITWAVKSL